MSLWFSFMQLDQFFIILKGINVILYHIVSRIGIIVVKKTAVSWTIYYIVALAAH